MKNLVTLMLSRDPNKRPRVHDILQLPIVKDRIKDFLTKTQQCLEFNHTVIHNKDLNLIHMEEQQKSSSHDYEDEEKFNQNSQISKREEEDKIKEAERQRVKEDDKRREEERKRDERRREEDRKRKAEDDRRKDDERRKAEELARQNSSSNRINKTESNRPISSSRRDKDNKQSGGSSQRGSKPKNPINVNNVLEKKEKLRNIDEKIELLQREREEARKINDEKKKKREEDRKQFLTDIKNKSLKKNNNDVEVYWSEKNALNRVEKAEEESYIECEQETISNTN